MNKSGMKVVFQELLYKEPLYQFIGKLERNMNLLVLGGDEAALAFVDQCLQAGQMTLHALNITVLTPNASEVEADYRRERPALADFVNVNGSLDGKETTGKETDSKETGGNLTSGKKTSDSEAGNQEVYAVLNFAELSGEAEARFLSEDVSVQEDQITDILSEAPDEKYHYFLITMGDNSVNRRLAGCLTRVLEDLMPAEENAVHYIVDGTEEQEGKAASEIENVTEGDQAAECGKTLNSENVSEKAFCPEGAVYIGNAADISSIDPDLERMAFNTDQSWADSINGNLLKEWEGFKQDTYRYLSSAAFAMSIRYKLADLDIPMDNLDEAAEAFANALKNSENDEVMNQMIALEHRRWVLEKVTDGWVAPTPEQTAAFYEGAVTRCRVNDKEKKIHPCIVHSTTATPLSTGAYSQDKACWDQKNAKLDGELDELDRMSVEIHRFMRSKALRFKDTDPVKNGVIAGIRRILEQESLKSRKMRKWEHFVYCVENILDGSLAYAKQYRLYQERFLEVIGDCSEDAQMQIRELLKQLDHEIWPVIEADMYRDYKKYDETLVRKISFILTYRMDLTLAVPFQTSDSVNKMNHVMFKNTASATVIKPAAIIWLLYLDEDASVDLVRPMIRRSVNYLNSKGIRSRKKLLVVGSPAISEEEQALWQKYFRKLAEDDVITSFALRFDEEGQDAIASFKELLATEKPDLFDGTSALFASSLENARFLTEMERDYPYFEFESAAKKFLHNDRCRYLSYIEDRTYLGIEEMFGLAGAEDIEFDYPILGREYKNLWNIYVGKNRDTYGRRFAVSNWNTLCKLLEKYDEDNPGAAQIELSELEKQYKKLHTGGGWGGILGLIKELAGEKGKKGEKGGKEYLIPIRENEQLTAFRYSDEEVHSLLTKGGSILEICIYFEVCRLGYFDDASCGYEFRWTEENIKNEFDLVLTKGFQSVIVECKAAREIKQDFYFKLNSLADLFGINAYQVLLTNRETDTGDNKMQKRRGTLMGVVTITETDDLTEMAKRLIELTR